MSPDWRDYPDDAEVPWEEMTPDQRARYEEDGSLPSASEDGSALAELWDDDEDLGEED